MTPEAKATQPARLAAILEKREKGIPLTEGEHALYVDYGAWLIARELKETPPDTEEALRILADAQDDEPSIRNK